MRSEYVVFFGFVEGVREFGVLWVCSGVVGAVGRKRDFRRVVFFRGFWLG